MAHEVGTKEVQPQATVGIRTTITQADIGSTLGQVLPEVWGYLEGQGVHPAGPPFVRHHLFQEDQVDLEASLPVAEPVAGEGRIAAGGLPGGEVATTWHAGPYDTLRAAYEAIEAWMRSQSREPAGPPREV